MLSLGNHSVCPFASVAAASPGVARAATPSGPREIIGSWEYLLYFRRRLPSGAPSWRYLFPSSSNRIYCSSFAGLLVVPSGHGYDILSLFAFLDLTKNEMIKMWANKCFYWFIDATFAMYYAYKSRTVCLVALGKGCIVSASTQKEMDTESFTEAEMVAFDDVHLRYCGRTYLLKSMDLQLNLLSPFGTAQL